jgi:hypothetical protein
MSFTPADLVRATTHRRFRALCQVSRETVHTFAQYAVTWESSRGERKTEHGPLDYLIPLLLDRLDCADVARDGAVKVKKVAR